MAVSFSTEEKNCFGIFSNEWFFRINTVMSYRTLISACKTNNLELLKIYEARHQKDLVDNNICGPKRYNPLQTAIYYDSYRIVKYFLEIQLIEHDCLQHSYGEDCLSYALQSRKTSSDIVKLLILNDKTFRLVNRCLDHGSQSLRGKLDDKFQTFVETLKAQNYVIPKTINDHTIAVGVASECDPEKIHYFLENIKLFAIDEERERQIIKKIVTNSNLFFSIRFIRNERSKWLEVMNRLFSIILGMFADEFGKLLLLSVIKMRTCVYTKIPEIFLEWINTWYLADSNEHHGLVERLLKQYSGIQNIAVIMGLHSSISKTDVSDCVLDSEACVYWFVKLTESLFKEVPKWEDEDITEVISVLRPKLDCLPFWDAFDTYLSRNFYIYSRKIVKSERVYNTVKILHAMEMGDKVQRAVDCKLQHIYWIIVMAFSTSVTADVYLPEIPHCLVDEFSKFCVHDEFRAKSSLQSLCCAKIRGMLLKSKCSHSQLVKHVKLLGLPNKLEQFLLFNTSNYDF